MPRASSPRRTSRREASCSVAAAVTFASLPGPSRQQSQAGGETVGTLNRGRRMITLCLIALTVGLAGIAARPSRSVASALGCHAAFQARQGFYSGNVYYAVRILRRTRITCGGALNVAARARYLRGLHLIRKPSNPGGWVGPFRVGAWHCFVLERGSDFLDGRCSLPGRSVRFYNHRQYWSPPEPGWRRPALRLPAG